MLKKYKKVYIITASIIIFCFILFLILFFNIPRLSYKYVETYDAYYVDKAYGNAKKYEIPDTYKNKEVIGIDTRAFYKHSNLREVILSDNIVVIERLAFSECKKLESINLDKVEIIYRNAFSYCSKLNDITLNATDIGASAFYKCESLNTLKLNEGIDSIGSMAFSHTILQNVTIPRSVTELGSDCFYGCYALQNIKVQGSNLKNNDYLKTLNIVTYIG